MNTEWEEHWAMRKSQGYSCTKRSKQIAQNQLNRLDRDGYDIKLLLNRSTDNLWRSFHRHPDCIKSKPLLETVTTKMILKSDPEKGKEAMKLINNLMAKMEVKYGR